MDLVETGPRSLCFDWVCVRGRDRVRVLGDGTYDVRGLRSQDAGARAQSVTFQDRRA